MGYTPSQIRYYIDENEDNSFFCNPLSWIETWWPWYDGYCHVTVSNIVFNRAADSHVGYHEYGHFVEFESSGMQYYDNYSEGHWFRKETTDNIAWTEGWATFFNAATHMYWYSVELPSKVEDERPGGETPSATPYKFLDYSQSILVSGRDNTKVEGAVACFLYSLWDGIEQRAPGYSGDNDDLTLAGSWLLDMLDNRIDLTGGLIGDSHVDSYRDALINILNSQTDASVNALYNNLILDSSTPARPATPTNLNISGNYANRTLSWNDNTCPSSVTYQEESGIYRTFNLEENQELGFRIYRKATGSAWDGTLNGYTLETTVGANVISWDDQADLVGNYSFVVVAYNSGGNSIPQAELQVTYASPPSDLAVSNQSIVGTENYIATNSITVGPAFTVESTGDLTLEAGTSVKFLPGFHAQAGSQLSATVGYVPPEWIFTVAISGPGSLEPRETGTYTATVTGGSGTTTYAWYKKTTGSYAYKGSGNPYDLSISPVATDDITLKVVVTRTGYTAEATKLVTIEGGAQPKALSGVPLEFALSQNHPNPFNPTTDIKFALPRQCTVSLRIYNITGREVQAWEINNALGYQSVHWAGVGKSGRSVPSGIYLYRLVATPTDGSQPFTKTRKMLLLK